MTMFISVAPKKASEVDLIKPLKNLIASYYSTSDEPVNLDDSIDKLNRLRIQCTNKTLDYKHEGAIDLLEKWVQRQSMLFNILIGLINRYYDQLTNLETKCPTNELQIPFKWKDSVGGSFILGSSSLTIPSLAYEKVCVLFNIAAAQTQTAAAQVNETLTNDASLKMAAKHFASASGVFQALKHLVPTAVGNQELTVDLHPDILHALHLILVSQAQECFFYKAANDRMKDAVIAKIAAQTEEYYVETVRFMLVKYSWPDKDWLPLVTMKQLAFRGIMEYYQSLVHKEKQEFGQELSRLQKSIEFLKQAQEKGGILFPSIFKDYSGKASRAFAEAKKDNDFIYHARIPDYKSLPSISPAILAKPIAIPPKFKQGESDLFDKLLPVPVQQAVSKLDVRKQEIVNAEIATLRDLTQVLNSTLSSLNLPAAIEDASGVQLPQSIKDKAAAVRNKGGLQEIDRLLGDLPDLFQRNREILDETERVLTAEEESDNKLREQFKERWTRTPSNKLNTYWKDNITKYRTVIQTAVEADNKVRQKVRDHRQKIELLTRADGDITKALPSATGSLSSGVISSAPTKRLRELMEQVEGIKNEREVIESELKSVAFTEMKSKFLKALSEDGAINEGALSAESLGQVYGPLQKQVRDSKVRQESLLTEVQRANQDFVQLKSSAACGGSSQRESFMSELAAAHDAFFEVLNNVSVSWHSTSSNVFFSQLNEGTKFYNDLTQLLVNLQNKVDDFCFARKAERDELCKDMQLAIANSANPPPPTVPSYHTNTSGTASSSAPPAQPVAPPVSAAAVQPVPFAHNPYAGAPQYYYPPPPLPSGYNPYAPVPAPQPGQCEFYKRNILTKTLMLNFTDAHPTVPGYPYPQQAPAPYPGYPYPQQPPRYWSSIIIRCYKTDNIFYGRYKSPQIDTSKKRHQIIVMSLWL